MNVSVDFRHGEHGHCRGVLSMFSLAGITDDAGLNENVNKKKLRPLDNP